MVDASYRLRCVQCGGAIIDEHELFCSRECEQGDTAPIMVAAEFESARRALGLSYRGMAMLLGLEASANPNIRRYELGETPVPGPLARLLRIIMHRKILQRELGVLELAKRYRLNKPGRPKNSAK